MHQPPSDDAAKHSRAFPSPPRVHWLVILLLLASAEGLVLWSFSSPYRNFASYVIAVAWPTYLCIWIRKVDHRASSLYWALASLVIGFGFLFSWLLWIVAIFELREELLAHYTRREPMDIRLNWFLTVLFSFIYFQYALNKISRKKETALAAVHAGSRSSVPA